MGCFMGFKGLELTTSALFAQQSMVKSEVIKVCVHPTWIICNEIIITFYKYEKNKLIS